MSHNNSSHFALRIPRSATKGKKNWHYNHPTGVQLIGDTLLVPVQTAYGSWLGPSFGDEAKVFLVDLTPLKQGNPPGDFKELMYLGYGPSASGVIDIPRRLINYTETDGRRCYLIATVEARHSDCIIPTQPTADYGNILEPPVGTGPTRFRKNIKI